MSEEELLILQVSNGNIGAETFAREAIELDHDAAVKGLKRLLDWDIPGEYFYALWNDCCERDTALAIEVMNTYSKMMILEAFDFFSHDRSKLRDIKKLKMQQLKNEKKKKIAFLIKKINVIIALIALFVGISNIFILSNVLRMIIWVILTCSLSVSLLMVVSEDLIISEENRLLKEESATVDLMFLRLENAIEVDIIDESSKKVIKSIVENGFEEVRHWRDIKWQRFAKK